MTIQNIMFHLWSFKVTKIQFEGVSIKLNGSYLEHHHVVVCIIVYTNIIACIITCTNIVAYIIACIIVNS